MSKGSRVAPATRNDLTVTVAVLKVACEQWWSGRDIGWEFVHVCIGDASRIAFAQVMPDDTKQSAVVFLNAAVTYYESLSVKVARVMTDNGGSTELWAHQFCLPSTNSIPIDRHGGGFGSRELGTSPGMTWNDLRAPNKTYDNPSAFNASCTFGRAFMRSMKALTFGKGKRSNSTRGAQRVTV